MNEAVSRPNYTSALPTRVGVIFGDLGQLNVSALKYLIAYLNTLQRSFEFELLESNSNDPLITLLKPGEVVDRESCRLMLPAFQTRIIGQIAREQQQYRLADNSTPHGFVIISMARFSDEHYGLKSGDLQVQALGDWERRMAPPSIFEFMITLLLRQAASFRAPAVSKSIHLGTKGCLFDFTPELGDVRYKSLQAYVCSICRERLRANGFADVADDLVQALDTRWLGKLDDPYSPASIVGKLGYNLFVTQGIKPTWSEVVRDTLRDEGTKELVKLIGAVMLAALLLWLGLSGKK
jgi:hypothetical protein